MRQYLPDANDMRKWPTRRFRPRIEPLEDRLLLSTFMVTNTDDSGAGSLRQAILDSNTTPDQNSIAFNIGDGGVQTIAPTSALPAIIRPVILDGTTQPGYAVTPLIELAGYLAGPSSGLMITAGSSTVRGLVINRFSGDGIQLQIGGGNIIAGNYIGTDVTGTADFANGGNGVHIITGLGNIIGGVAPNLISGNGLNGIALGAGGPIVAENVIVGNTIGTDVTGTAALGNGSDGVLILSGASNIIGEPAPLSHNLISGNGRGGVEIYNSDSTGNVVQGNAIGTDITGTTALGNGVRGVLIQSGSGNLIGGPGPGAGNVISGNGGDGLVMTGGASGNVVVGNYIGTDASLQYPLGNLGDGVFLITAPNNVIGATDNGAGNVIANNGRNGVEVWSFAGNVIRGNSIFANGDLGIRLTQDGNNNQSAPTLNVAFNVADQGPTLIIGLLVGSPNTAFTVDFYANSSSPGQGGIYVGSGTVVTNFIGTGVFQLAIAPVVPLGLFITATATGLSGTSQFSNSAVVNPPGEPPGRAGAPSSAAKPAAFESVALLGISALLRGTLVADLPALASPIAPGSQSSSTDRLATGQVPGPAAAELFFGKIGGTPLGQESLRAGWQEGLPDSPAWDFYVEIGSRGN